MKCGNSRRVSKERGGGFCNRDKTSCEEMVKGRRKREEEERERGTAEHSIRWRT